jgi:hypothetical protein
MRKKLREGARVVHASVVLQLRTSVLVTVTDETASECARWRWCDCPENVVTRHRADVAIAELPTRSLDIA